jgi:hypothetical protein
MSIKQLQSAVCALCLVLLSNTAHAQARLIIENNSQRQMTVKVMNTSNGADTLHQTISIVPVGTQTVYFSETGDYFCKTMAVLSGRDPVYQKGEAFRVYNGRDGYSVITLTFSITESAVPQVLGGKEISKREFDRDSSEP